MTFMNVSVSAPAASLRIDDFNPKNGLVGTVVTLTGANLSSATAATVNGVNVQYTNVLATEVRVTVPRGAADGLIRVTEAG